MSQTNTQANNSQNQNQNPGRSGRGGSPNSSSGRGDCRNNCRNKLIAKYAFKGKRKTVRFSNSQLLNQGTDLLNSRNSGMLFPYSARIKITVVLMKSFVPDMIQLKVTSFCPILTPPYDLIHTKYKSSSSVKGPP